MDAGLAAAMAATSGVATAAGMSASTNVGMTAAASMASADMNAHMAPRSWMNLDAATRRPDHHVLPVLSAAEVPLVATESRVDKIGLRSRWDDMHPRAIVASTEVPSVMVVVSLKIEPSVIEGTVPIVVAPISPDREGHDGESDFHGIFRQQHPAPPVHEIEVAPCDPTPLATPADIAPGIAREAAMDVHCSASGQRVDHGKAGARAGTQIETSGDEAWPRRCCGGDGKRSGRGRRYDQIIPHLVPLSV